MSRIRLTREERRTQLIDLGMQMVEASSFDAVSVDDVAARAGISRSLLFHYFPTKRDFQLALAEHAADDLLDRIAPDLDLDPIERLRAGSRNYIDYVAERREAYLSLVRGAAGGDDAMRAVFDGTRAQIAEWMLIGLGHTPEDAPQDLWLAARGWVALVEEMCIVWLQTDALGRDEFVDLMERATTALFAGLGVDLATLPT